MEATVLAWVSFTSFTMLGWAGAALIPVIIHLLRRRKKVLIPWAAMQLLRQVVEQESRRVNLQQLLLLFLRVSILLLLAFALARPLLTQSKNIGALSIERPSKLWIFVLDTSYSMGYQKGELTRMERARQRIAKRISESQEGDAFALIALDNPARVIIGRPTFDSEAVFSEVQRLADNARGSDPVSAFDMAAQIATDALANPSMPQDVEVVLVSDFGLDAWQSASEGAMAASRQRLGQVARVTFEPIVDSSPKNLAIEGVELSQNRLQVGRPLTVAVTVASYGQPVTNLPVQLEWDGQIVATEVVDLGAEDRTSVSLTLTPGLPGVGVLSVVIPADGLPIDNRYDRALEVREGFRVLIVETPSRSQNPWKIALQPEASDRPGNSKVDVRVVTELQWQSMNDQDWDAILLDDLPLSTVNQLGRLNTYVKAGGSLIVAFGKNLAPIGSTDSHPAQSIETARQELFGFRLTQPSELGDWVVDPLEYSSPIIRLFKGFPSSGLLTTPLFRYWRIEPVDSSLVVDLATTKGDPLLIRRHHGKGSIASFMSAPEDGRERDGADGWNAITTWPSFLPLAQQTLQILLDDDAADLNRIAGQALSGSLNFSIEKQPITLVRPDRSEVQITGQQMPGFEGTIWSYEETDQAGVYRVREPENARQVFTVNIDPNQSSLQSLDPKGLGPAAEIAFKEDANHLLKQSTSADQLSRILLLGLALLLLTESLAAKIFGGQIG